MASTVLGDSRARASFIVRPTEENSLSDCAELAVLHIQKYTRLTVVMALVGRIHDVNCDYKSQ